MAGRSKAMNKASNGLAKRTLNVFHKSELSHFQFNCNLMLAQLIILNTHLVTQRYSMEIFSDLPRRKRRDGAPGEIHIVNCAGRNQPNNASALYELRRLKQFTTRNGKACHYLVGAGRQNQDMLLKRQTLCRSSVIPNMQRKYCHAQNKSGLDRMGDMILSTQASDRIRPSLFIKAAAC